MCAGARTNDVQGFRDLAQGLGTVGFGSGPRLTERMSQALGLWASSGLWVLARAYTHDVSALNP